MAAGGSGSGGSDRSHSAHAPKAEMTADRLVWRHACVGQQQQISFCQCALQKLSGLQIRFIHAMLLGPCVTTTMKAGNT